MMELREFVSETIMDVMLGVKDAQEKCAELGGNVNPQKTGRDGLSCTPDTAIDFNIGLSESTGRGKDSGGKIGVDLGFLGANYKGVASERSVRESRTCISFTLNVKLPTQQ